MADIRLRYRKVGKVRFLGHRDVARVLERAIRRAGLPIRYSEGFAPRPRISFGLALSTGYESEAEYLDLALTGPQEPESVPAMVNETLPEGLEVTAVVELAPRALSLQQAVTSCTWELTLVDTNVDTVSSAVARALEAQHLPAVRERKGRQVTDDLRPLVRALTVDGPDGGGVRLLAELGTQPRAVRPAELAAVLDPPPNLGSVRRLQQWIYADGARLDPLEAAGSATRTGACA